MQFPINILTWILVVPFILSFPTVNSDPRATSAGNLTCGTGDLNSSNSIPTFFLVMQQLSGDLNSSNGNFALLNTTVFKAPFFALIQCHRDLSHADCQTCYAVSRTTVSRCLPNTSGRLFLDGCFLRFDNYTFFQEAIDPATDDTNCSSSLLTSNNFNDFQGGVLGFNRSVGELVKNITELAVNNGGFGVMELNGVYGLAQCWESLTKGECMVCLDKARTEAVGCLPSREGRIMNAGCFLRYSTHNFTNHYSFPAVNSDPRANPAGNLTCGQVRATTTSFIPTFVQAMERLSYNLNASNSNFAVTNFTASSSSPPFFALIQCHRDLSHADCQTCYAVTRTAVAGCLPRTSGRIFLDGCFVRYDNYTFFQQAIDPSTDATNCYSLLKIDSFNNFQGGPLEFNLSVGELFEKITQLAISNGGFGAMELNGVYGLAQCWESLTNEECRVCLNKGRTEAVGCLPSRAGRSMNAGCFLRYSTHNFINNYSQAEGGTSQANGGTSGISFDPFFI